MRTATLHCHDADGAWTETYKEGDAPSTFRAGDDVEAWARRMVASFNDTLRKGEERRTLDRVEVSDDGAADAGPEWHDWHKTNAITISDAQGVYDTLRCGRCGITAKRFGLQNVRLDAAYRAKAFRTCAGALALLARRKAKEEAR